MIRRSIAHIFWLLFPWTFKSEPAPTRPSILIGAPHTSNWDFVIMLALAWRLQIPIRWLGKDSLFRSWYGPLFKAVGGIPVNRKNPAGLVDAVVARVKSGEVFSLVITPDGTRTSTGYWKSGFYRISRATGMPVVLGYVDRTTRTAGLGPTIELTGNVEADMDRIRAFYADKAGVNPEKRREPRLRDESGKDAALLG